MEKIGKILKKSRQAKGFTQLEVSRFLGNTSSQYISNIERGLCDPSLRTISKLLELYDLNAQDVIESMLQKYRQELVKKLKPETKSKNRGK